MATIAAARFILLAALVVYLRLRRAEDRDWLDERSADRATLEQILERENHYAQNHMVSVTHRSLEWCGGSRSGLSSGYSLSSLPGSFAPVFSEISLDPFLPLGHGAGTRDFLFFFQLRRCWESYLEISSRGRISG